MTQRSHYWTRREMLRGLGLGAAALPFVPRLAEADPGQPPRRLIVFLTTTGMTGAYPNGFAPTGSESNFTLSPILEPLAGGQMVNGLTTRDIKSKSLIIQGLDNKAMNDTNSPSNGHPKGMGTALTGIAARRDGNGKEWAGGISIDQLIANRIGAGTAFPQGVHLGVGAFDQGVIRGHMSYTGPSQPVAIESNPVRAFDSVFGNFVPGGGSGDLERLRARRQSVVDYVRGDLNAVKGKLGAASRQKMDAHLDAIRNIELRLSAELGCDQVPDVDFGGFNANGNGTYGSNMFPLAGRLQMDILAHAMACDLTRVGTIMWGSAPTNAKFTWVDGGWQSNQGFHELSHVRDNENNFAEAQTHLRRVARWYAQQFTYLCTLLDSIPEPGGGGSMLDHTVIMWTSENSKSNRHDWRNMPYVLAGSAGGYFKTGRYLQYGGVHNNRLFVTLANAMGLDDVEEFGDAQYDQGPLSELR